MFCGYVFGFLVVGTGRRREKAVVAAAQQGSALSAKYCRFSRAMSDKTTVRRTSGVFLVFFHPTPLKNFKRDGVYIFESKAKAA